jgi:thiamine-monophosphate kinase
MSRGVHASAVRKPEARLPEWLHLPMQVHSTSPHAKAGPFSQAGQTVASLGERALISRIKSRAGTPPAWVRLGIGDDAAVLEPARGSIDVVTTDSLVEGVHFRRDWTAPAAIGHKALAVNLSDLAAMGAQPRACLLTLALPPDLPLGEFDALVDALVTLAEAAGAPLVGGNLTRSPGPLVVDVTAIGAVGRRKCLTRAGGRPGDDLYVTGRLGAAAAGLAMLNAGLADRSRLDPMARECVARYEQPDARSRCGLIVGRTRAASACMDVSDGLADAASQLAGASGTGVVLEADDVPIHPGASAWSVSANREALDLALSGGEDYELLFAVPRPKRSRLRAAARLCGDLPFTRVGRLTADPGAWLNRTGRPEPLGPGFAHF